LGNLKPSHPIPVLKLQIHQITKLPDGLGILRMATADKKSLFVNGENAAQMVTTGNPITDLERAQDVGAALSLRVCRPYGLPASP